MQSNFRWFVRPTIGVLLCFLVAIGVALLASTFRPGVTDAELATAEEFVSKVAGMRSPNATLTPEDVVRIQIDSLEPDQGIDGILQCMRFATPGNLAITGPADRFGKMVRSEQFAPLCSHDAMVIGKAMFHGRNARLLVTVSKRSQIHSYIWVLEQQTGTPWEGCWLTDGVFPLKNHTEGVVVAEDEA